MESIYECAYACVYLVVLHVGLRRRDGERVLTRVVELIYLLSEHTGLVRLSGSGVFVLESNEFVLLHDSANPRRDLVWVGRVKR